MVNHARQQLNYTKQLNLNDDCNLKSYDQRLGDEPDTNAEKNNTRLLSSLTCIVPAPACAIAHIQSETPKSRRRHHLYTIANSYK